MTTSWIRVATRALLALGIAAGTANAVILHVDDDGLDPFECEGAPYHTITAAIAAAKSGDEIRVCPGVYAEQLVIDKQLRLTGVSFGSARPVIRPTALPATRPSLMGDNPLAGGNPVAAGILIDDGFVRLENLDVDMSASSPVGCFPMLAGIYLRNTSGELDRMRVFNVAVAGRPECDSGVGVYIESGVVSQELGVPIIGLARVRVRDSEFSGYQKAGLVANGPRAILIVKGGSATGLGPTGGAVQAGYQLGYGARGIIADVTVRDHASTIVGKAATGVLVFDTDRVNVKHIVASDSESGVLGAGNRIRVKKSSFSDMTGDGIVFLGNANLASGNLIERSSVSGVFVLGDNNAVRGGIIRQMDLGIWFQFGFGNKWAAVKFVDVPVAGQGLYGGVRADMNLSSPAPVTTVCDSALACDDGDACSVDTCDTEGLCGFTPLVCDDTNECTADSCDSSVGCVNTPLTGTPCNAGLGVCNAGVCA